MKNMLENALNAITEYQAALVELDNLGDGPCYIVRCDNIFLTFDVAPDGAAYNVFNVRDSKPHQARRFNWQDAHTVAGIVRGDVCPRGDVVHVRVAVEQVLDSYKAVIAALEAFARGEDPTL